MQKVIVECCANSVSSALTAIQAGANRIELCKNLENGGETPDYSDILELRNLTDIDLHILILPKANNFIYSNKDFKKIIEDIQFCKKNKINGVVIGALNKDLSINMKQTKKLVEIARPMRVTFHRAFDTISKLENNLNKIIECGCDYLLTSGQKPNVDDGLNNLSKLVKQSSQKIKIIAGGGVNHNNVESLYKIGLREFHLSGTLKNKSKILETDYNLINLLVKKLRDIQN
ncbi:copper homeostasis protein CutC [bacterium]|nr:copper homeostasis protein CutC [bacterium]